MYNEERQRKLRNEVIRLKAQARQSPLGEWVDQVLAVIEREKIDEVERYKERVYMATPRAVLTEA